MSMNYKPIGSEDYYKKALTDPSKTSKFSVVWGVVDSIDLQDYIDQYNRLEHSANVIDLSSLETRLVSDMSRLDSAIRMYPSDPDVTLAASEMKNRLQEVRNNTHSRIEHFTRGLGRFKPIQKIEGAMAKVDEFEAKIKPGWRKVVAIKNKITYPAKWLFEHAQSDNLMQDVMNMIGSIGNTRKGH